MITIAGRARRLGDDINTDYIISSKRKRETIDDNVLKRYLLEGVDPGFAATVGPDDLLVAGRNFGCGSAMEVAVTVILAAGIKAVVAESFARAFYRNAINNGLIPVECVTDSIREGDRLQVTVDAGRVQLLVGTQLAPFECAPLAPIAAELLTLGGIVPYIKRHGNFGTTRAYG